MRQQSQISNKLQNITSLIKNNKQGSYIILSLLQNAKNFQEKIFH